MGILVQFVAGVLFSLGLVVSGMANPAKVLNFLDIAGTWDPSLAFVMSGAVVVAAIGYQLVLARPGPVFASSFDLPTKRTLDVRIFVGPAIVGIGWGLSGYCPGPAVTSLVLAASGTIVFVPAMLIGMALAKWLMLRPGDDDGRSRLAATRTPGV